MIQIGPAEVSRAFNIEDLDELAGLLVRITAQPADTVSCLRGILETSHSEQEKSVVSAQIQTLFEEWSQKISRLGGIPRGLWLADFDSGNGYYCWKFPETRIDFWHRYDEGFTHRRGVGLTPFQGCDRS